MLERVQDRPKLVARQLDSFIGVRECTIFSVGAAFTQKQSLNEGFALAVLEAVWCRCSFSFKEALKDSSPTPE